MGGHLGEQDQGGGSGGASLGVTPTAASIAGGGQLPWSNQAVIVQTQLLLAPMLPAASVPVTKKWCVPAASPV